ncbi:Protoheme IX farnesyltransferase 1 [Bienertia sinuspersici]
MRMKMFLWDHGYLVWMFRMLMTKHYVVVPHQIVSGKLRQATFAWPHSIGAAVVSAALKKGSSRFSNVVGKVRMKSGKPLSETNMHELF